MPRLLLLLVGVLPIAGCMTAAHMPSTAYATLPPPGFDVSGPVRVNLVDRAQLAVACRNVVGGYDPSVNGCMIRRSSPCTVYVLNENHEEARQVERHERAHCAGWRHH